MLKAGACGAERGAGSARGGRGLTVRKRLQRRLLKQSRAACQTFIDAAETGELRVRGVQGLGNYRSSRGAGGHRKGVLHQKRAHTRDCSQQRYRNSGRGIFHLHEPEICSVQREVETGDYRAPRLLADSAGGVRCPRVAPSYLSGSFLRMLAPEASGAERRPRNARDRRTGARWCVRKERSARDASSAHAEANRTSGVPELQRTEANIASRWTGKARCRLFPLQRTGGGCGSTERAIHR